MKSTRKLLFLSYLERMTNEYVRSKVESHVGTRDPIRAIAKQWKLIWFGNMLHGTIAYANYQAGHHRLRS